MECNEPIERPMRLEKAQVEINVCAPCADYGLRSEEGKKLLDRLRSVTQRTDTEPKT